MSCLDAIPSTDKEQIDSMLPIYLDAICLDTSQLDAICLDTSQLDALCLDAS